MFKLSGVCTNWRPVLTDVKKRNKKGNKKTCRIVDKKGIFYNNKIIALKFCFYKYISDFGYGPAKRLVLCVQQCYNVQPGRVEKAH